MGKVPAPIVLLLSQLNIPVKDRKGPVSQSLDAPMPDVIVIQEIHVPVQVSFAAD